MKERISIIIKANNKCNLQCKHCYEERNDSTNNERREMLLSTIEKVFTSAQSSYERINYVWFGGEPLLNGIDWFESAINLQKKHLKNNKIKNRLQTNGTLLNESFSKFFIKEGFNISISYDGQFNDVLRQQTNNVENGIRNVQNNGGKCGIISTIHAKNYLHQIEMYEHFKKMNCPMKFNAMFPLGRASTNYELALDIDKYTQATVRFFEYWCKDANAFPVSNFIQFVRLYNEEYGCNCTYGNCLYNWLCIEPNGDITPCSRFSVEKYKLGNVLEIKDFEDIFKNNKYNDFVKENIIRRLKCKKNCLYYKYCNGGCSSSAANEVGLENQYSQFCRITKSLLPIIFTVLKKLLSTNQVNNKMVLEILQIEN